MYRKIIVKYRKIIVMYRKIIESEARVELEVKLS
jgi:hypothetical protein